MKKIHTPKPGLVRDLTQAFKELDKHREEKQAMKERFIIC